MYNGVRRWTRSRKAMQARSLIGFGHLNEVPGEENDASCSVDLAGAVLRQHCSFAGLLLRAFFRLFAARKRAVHREHTRLDDIGIGHDVDTRYAPASECALHRGRDILGSLHQFPSAPKPAVSVVVPIFSFNLRTKDHYQQYETNN